jgi:hypothetical protein
MSIKARIERLEQAVGTRCRTCADWPSYVVIDLAGNRTDPRCPDCGWHAGREPVVKAYVGFDVAAV